MKTSSLFFLLLLFLNACDYYDYRLVIVNETNGMIVAETDTDTLPKLPRINKTEFYLDRGINPQEQSRLMKGGKNGWPFAIKRSKNNKLNLFVYNIDSLKKYKSIDSLVAKKKYSRYEFSEDELEANDWKVVIK